MQLKLGSQSDTTRSVLPCPAPALPPAPRHELPLMPLAEVGFKAKEAVDPDLFFPPNVSFWKLSNI